MANSLLWQKRRDDHDYPTLYLSTQRLTIALRKYILYPHANQLSICVLKNAGPCQRSGYLPFPSAHWLITTSQDHTSFAATTPVQDDSKPSSLSSASYASGNIQVLSPMCSDLHVPGMLNAVYMKLDIDTNCTGVPKVFASKTLLQYVGQISAPSITAGTCLETGSLHPVNHGMHRKIVQCIYAEHGRAILEVATYYNGEEGKMRVWETLSFLVSLQAILVNMPVTEVPTPWALWSCFPCLRCL